MACKACQQQRNKVRQAFSDGNFKRATHETVKGVGMMAGILPKTDPRSKLKR